MEELQGGGGITLGTLFYEAKARRWPDDGTYQKPTPEEIEARRREAAERAAKEKARSDREHAKTASKARAVWKAASPATADHPYLLRKRVSPVPSLREVDAGAAADLLGYAPKYRDKSDKLNKRLVGRLLVVPVKVAGKLSTLELIDEGGHKSVLSGGRKSGGFWAAQPLPKGDGTGLTLLIGEGVATGLSARKATGDLVIAALSAGNLPVVAKAMRKRYPAAKRGILADLGNGQKDAEKAARATGAALVLPDFGEDRPEGATDLNDLHAHRGLGAVTECIAAQLAAHDARQHTAGEKAPGGDESRSGNGASSEGSCGGEKAEGEGQTGPGNGAAPGGGSGEDATGDAEDLEATVRRLAGLSPIEYDRERKAEAKRLRVRVTTLDAGVKKFRPPDLKEPTADVR